MGSHDITIYNVIVHESSVETHCCFTTGSLFTNKEDALKYLKGQIVNNLYSNRYEIEENENFKDIKELVYAETIDKENLFNLLDLGSENLYDYSKGDNIDFISKREIGFLQFKLAEEELIY